MLEKRKKEKSILDNPLSLLNDVIAACLEIT